VVESAEQIGIVPLPKWESAHNATSQNYLIELAHTVGTIKDAQLSQPRQVKPFP